MQLAITDRNQRVQALQRQPDRALALQEARARELADVPGARPTCWCGTEG
jgi:hypothetical protein